jgi:AraC-like DNA-binding protein
LLFTKTNQHSNHQFQHIKTAIHHNLIGINYHYSLFLPKKIMLVQRFNPTYPLNDYIEMYWYLKGYASELAIQQQLITPDTHTNLVLNFGSEMKYYKSSDKNTTIKDAVYIGQQSKAYTGVFGEIIDVITIRFKPYGASCFMDLPVRETSEEMINPDFIFGKGMNSLRDQIYSQVLAADKIRILDKWLLSLLKTNSKNEDSFLKDIINQINENKGLKFLYKISNNSGSEYKKIQRSFNTHIGISPKMFSRMLRFDNICHQALNQKNADRFTIIATYNLSDQSHLIKEFHSFSGFSPAEFIKSIENKTISWV